MKKRILFSFLLAFVLLFSISGATLACDIDVDVEISEVTVTPIDTPVLPWAPALTDGYYVGSTIEVSGAITIDSYANVGTWAWWPMAEASSDASVAITAPDGTPLFTDGNTEYELDNSGSSRVAEASQTFNWDYQLQLTSAGDYVIVQEGTAEASWEYWTVFQLWWYKHTDSDSASDILTSTITSHSIPEMPQPEVQPPWYGISGFTVYINNSFLHYQTTTWVSVPSRELAGNIDLSGDGINVAIPAGTVVNEGADWLAGNLGLNYHNGVLSFVQQNITFSNPVVITADDGTVLLEFTKLVNGIPE